MNKKTLFFPSLEIKKIDESVQTTQFIFEHLDLGLAATLGNALRRILLTRIPGLAIFALKISDKKKTIASEFGNGSKLEGVKEIPTYLISHLKKLAFQLPQKEIPQPGKVYTLQIDIDNSQKKENYIVTGKDIQGDLKVINPDVYLATVEEHSQLRIILYCCYYYASQSANSKEQKALLPNEEKLIFLDCDYCPVESVSWKVEPAAIVDVSKQEEKLILTITTNGSISPQDSLSMALNFLEQTMISIQRLLPRLGKIETKAS